MQQTFHPQHTTTPSLVYTHQQPIQKLSVSLKAKKTNPRVCVYVLEERMSAVVLTDVDTAFPSDEDIRIDNANLDALAESVTSVVDTQILCFGLIYLLLGCMIAYIDCKRLKRWQWRLRRSVAA